MERNLMATKRKINPDLSQEKVTISERDLPLCCPLPNQLVWNLHPRVYLPIIETGKATCPYCGTHYILKQSF